MTSPYTIKQCRPFSWPTTQSAVSRVRISEAQAVLRDSQYAAPGTPSMNTQCADFRVNLSISLSAGMVLCLPDRSPRVTDGQTAPVTVAGSRTYPGGAQ